MQHTKVNPKWLVKIVIFLALLAGLGAWGLFDAMYAYPRRGEASARWARYEYLKAARGSNELTRASVADPAAEFGRLREARDDLARQAEGDSLAARRAQTELKRLQWLEALGAIGAVEPARTRIEDPVAALNELDAALAGGTAPKPLAAWDIPLQWVFVVVGFGGALWLASLIVRVRATRFAYDPERRALTLPGGGTITPDDLAELDKRKWDKFLVTLRLKQGAPVRLDLLRHTPLEEWVLEMERAAGLADEADSPDAAADESADSTTSTASAESVEREGDRREAPGS